MKDLLVLAIVVVLAGCSSVEPESDNPMPSKQVAKHFEFKSNGRERVGYLLFLPVGYKERGHDKWPLMLFLHGAGERGDDVWKVATHGPPKHVKEHPDFPFIVLSPQCPEGQTWSRPMLLALLEDICGTYHVDPRRVYATGLSMGGYGTWDLGLSYPEKFAAIVPICGGGNYITTLLATREKPQALRTLPVWVFHGAKDPVVPLSESQRMVDFLKKADVREVKFTVYPNAEHNSWAETYANPDLYKWLLEHRREPTKK
jgi:predicted peptidase